MKQTTLPFRLACLTASTVLLSSLAITPAIAADGDDLTKAITDAAPEVAKDIETNNGTALTREGEEITAEIPAESEPVDGLSPASFSLTYVPTSDFKKVVQEKGSTDFATYEDGVAVTAIDHQDDSQQFVSVIDSPSAEHSQTYRVTSEENVNLQLDEDGSVAILDDSGDFIGGVSSPWAKDATGETVPTHFTISGDTITQHTETADSSQYPLVVDPWGGKKLIKSAWTKFDGKSTKRWVVNVIPTKWGRQANGLKTHKSHVAELKSKVGKKRVTKTIDNQFICHVFGNVFEPGTYNMESWRPNMHWRKQLNLKHQCNPK